MTRGGTEEPADVLDRIGLTAADFDVPWNTADPTLAHGSATP